MQWERYADLVAKFGKEHFSAAAESAAATGAGAFGVFENSATSASASALAPATVVSSSVHAKCSVLHHSHSAPVVQPVLSVRAELGADRPCWVTGPNANVHAAISYVFDDDAMYAAIEADERMLCENGIGNIGSSCN